MFDSKIYECQLLSIYPGIDVDINKTKKENIKNAINKEHFCRVMPIMVQPTLNPKYFREIITKKLIPVCRIRRRYNYISSLYGDLEYMVPDIPCFIKYYETLWYGDRTTFDLKIAQPQRIKEYIKKHISHDGTYNKFLIELNEIFKKSEEYYASSYTVAKDERLKEKDVKKLIKTVRKKSSL